MSVRDFHAMRALRADRYGDVMASAGEASVEQIFKDIGTSSEVCCTWGEVCRVEDSQGSFNLHDA